MSELKLVINGREIGFTPGQTILEAAARHDIVIPTLCHLEGTTPHAKCGICVVEIDGEKELKTACNTPCSEGMTVKTESVRVVADRKKTLEAMIASGHHNCAASSAGNDNWTAFQLETQAYDGTDELCPVWGDCRLQDLLYQYQVTQKKPVTATPPMEREDVNPLIIRDFSRCILCGRCVAACNEVQVNKVIQFGTQDGREKVVTKHNTVLADSDCVFCGECIQACPVGALVEKKAVYDWRPWKEDRRVRTTCPYCGVGCQQILHIKDDKIVKVTGAEDGRPNLGRLCVKGRFGYDFIYSDERLKTPLIRENDQFREASWDEALDLVANRFKEIIATDGPDAIAGVSCARSINEDSYQMQKLFRAVIKTNNIDHCART